MSKPPEETLEPNQEEPAQVPPEQVAPEVVPGPSQPDTSIPEDPEDLTSWVVTLQDMKDYLAAAGEDEWALIQAELTPGRLATNPLCCQPAGAFRIRRRPQSSRCPRILKGV